MENYKLVNENIVETKTVEIKTSLYDINKRIKGASTHIGLLKEELKAENIRLLKWKELKAEFLRLKG